MYIVEKFLDKLMNKSYLGCCREVPASLCDLIHFLKAFQQTLLIIVILVNFTFTTYNFLGVICILEELIHSVDVVVIKAYTKTFNQKGTTKFKQA